MPSFAINLSDDHKSEIDSVAERNNYNIVSDYVREALRVKVEEDLVLRPGVAEKLPQRVKLTRKDEAGGSTHAELDEELGSSQEVCEKAFVFVDAEWEPVGDGFFGLDLYLIAVLCCPCFVW